MNPRGDVKKPCGDVKSPLHPQALLFPELEAA